MATTMTRASFLKTLGPSSKEIDVAALDSWDCGICTHPYGVIGSEMAPVRLHDQHIFCSACAHCWLESSNTCPLCRRELFAPTIDGTTLNDDDNDNRSPDSENDTDSSYMSFDGTTDRSWLIALYERGRDAERTSGPQWWMHRIRETVRTRDDYLTSTMLRGDVYLQGNLEVYPEDYPASYRDVTATTAATAATAAATSAATGFPGLGILSASTAMLRSMHILPFYSPEAVMRQSVLPASVHISGFSQHVPVEIDAAALARSLTGFFMTNFVVSNQHWSRRNIAAHPLATLAFTAMVDALRPLNSLMVPPADLLFALDVAVERLGMDAVETASRRRRMITGDRSLADRLSNAEWPRYLVDLMNAVLTALPNPIRIGIIHGDESDKIPF